MTMPDFPSTQAADAYKRAQAEIAKAKADGDSGLWLNGTDGFSALTHLPPEIADLEGLRYLSLSHTQITDDGLRHIAGMEGLEDLSLSHTKITDDGLRHIAGMEGLGSLNLFQTQITDDGLRHVAGMEGLEDLHLSQTQITNDGLRHIAGMEGLRILELSQTQITDDGLRHIAGMEGLWSLDLSQTQITDDGLRHVAGMEGLEVLNLSQTQITDHGLRHIAGMEGLGNLDLSQTQITDDGLRHVAGMEGLSDLHLSQTQIGLPGLQHLAQRDGVLRDADGDYGWLYLEGTPALHDDGLRAVYEGTKDGPDRTKAVLDYARDWVPPVPDDAPFAPRYHMDGAGPIRSDPVHPSDAAAELAALQQLTLQKAARLIDVLGPSNEYAWVKTAAEHYVAQMQVPFTKLALQLLYSHANTLLKAYQQHLDARESGRLNEELPAALVNALADVVETHGLLWANIPEAADIQAKVADYIQGPRREKAAALAAEIVTDLDGKTDVLAAPDHAAMVDDMEAAKGNVPAAAVGEAGLVGRVWNAIGAFGRAVTLGVSRAAVQGIIGGAADLPPF